MEKILQNARQASTLNVVTIRLLILFKNSMDRLIIKCLLACILVAQIQAGNSIQRAKSIEVIGNKTLNRAEILNIAALEIYKEINTNDIQQALKNLWSLGIYSDINMYATDYNDNYFDLIVQVKELPRLNKLILNGNHHVADDNIIETLNYTPGIAISTHDLHQIRRSVKNIYKDRGYLQAQIKIYTIPEDSLQVQLIVDIIEGEKIEIGEIIFHGNVTYSKSQLVDVFEETKENTWLKSTRFSEDGFIRDLERLSDFYRSRGFRDAEIVKDTIYYKNDDPDMCIEIWLNEGKPSYFQRIEFEGTTVFPDDQLYQCIGFKINDLYNTIKIKQALEKYLTDLYSNLGYVYTSIKLIEIPTAEDSVAVFFRIDEGKQVTTRKISISGNTTINEDLIRRQLRIEPGQVFDKTLLSKSCSDLESMGYFTSIDPLLIPVDEQNVNIKIELAEKKLPNPDFSVGWSQLNKLTGGIGFHLDNIIGNGCSVDINANLRYGGHSVSTEYNEPFLFNRPISAGLKVYYSDQIETIDGYRQKSLGGLLHIGHQWGGAETNYRMDWIYRYDYSQYADFSDHGDGTNRRWPLRTNSLKNIISRSSLDRPDFPTSGLSIVLTNEIAAKFLGGNAEYHKHRINADWYTPVADNLVLRLNCDAGYLNSWTGNDHIPNSRRIFSVDDEPTYPSIPLGPYSNPISITSYTPNGGLSLFRAGFEMRYQVLNQPLFYILTFARAGLTAENFSNLSTDDLRHSVGFGFRIDLPFLGIIGIDCLYGSNFSDPFHEAEKGKWQFHLIIGNLF